MKIRDFRQEDFDNGLVECLRALGPTDYAGREWAVVTFAGHRAAAGIRTFVAVDEDDRVLGTASLFFFPTFLYGGEWAGHIEDVAVRADLQRRGVGRALVRHCVDVAREKECYKVVLTCAPDKVPFYEKCGFYRSGNGFMRIDFKE
jgi:glucosamine-phosphate N-acetyltransferase